MKHLMLLAAVLVFAGCAENPTTTDAANTGAAIDTQPVLTSFEAGETATLEVPEMHCPFACYPSVKETLKALDGVAEVELVEQAEEGKINDPRVVVTFDGAVDGKSAIAALDDASFPGARFESRQN